MSKSDESADDWNYTVPASTRLSDQTAERLRELQEREDIGKSAALRQATRAGLDELEPDEEGTNTSEDTGQGLLFIGAILGAFALLGSVTGSGGPDQWVFYLAAGMIAAGLYLNHKHD